ncbi:hypothetical protein NLO88_02040 [Pseudomonas syringae]|nr:hypothetical protein [Pseudomonas syringae]
MSALAGIVPDLQGIDLYDIYVNRLRRGLGSVSESRLFIFLWQHSIYVGAAEGCESVIPDTPQRWICRSALARDSVSTADKFFD